MEERFKVSGSGLRNQLCQSGAGLKTQGTWEQAGDVLANCKRERDCRKSKRERG